MGNVTLADYVRHCRPALARVRSSFYNTLGAAAALPILRRGILNTILVFPVFFNPPTANHAEGGPGPEHRWVCDRHPG